MPLLKSPTHFDFMRVRRIALGFSGALVVISLVALGLRGLNLGLDFTGGVLVEVDYGHAVQLQDVRRALTQAGYTEAVVQSFGTASDVLIRLPPEAGGQKAKSASASNTPATGAPAGGAASNGAAAENGAAGGAGTARGRPGTGAANGGSGTVSSTEIGQEVLAALRTQDPAVSLRQAQSIGAEVGQDLSQQGGVALLITFAVVFIYVMVRFRWKFAAGAIVALIHDVIIVLGAFAIFQWEFNLTVLAAVLAVVGYSLNDTIVVYDRIRENFKTVRRGSAIKIMNASVNETLSRTINTSMTVMIVLVALLVLGGSSVSGFSIALIIGTVTGTYSSIYIAAALALLLKVTPQDMVPPKREEIDALP
ncbi:MAG TPA: protein translocase subunit SecF [Gammaproteobacteria bacterium]|nr:protein translocase subunit SecF [Gammaproteobacteria bacterium]